MNFERSPFFMPWAPRNVRRVRSVSLETLMLQRTGCSSIFHLYTQVDKRSNVYTPIIGRILAAGGPNPLVMLVLNDNGTFLIIHRQRRGRGEVNFRKNSCRCTVNSYTRVLFCVSCRVSEEDRSTIE